MSCSTTGGGGGGGAGAGAVIRVKRHINEEPLNALILNCKKRKINVESTIEEIPLAAASSTESIVKTPPTTTTTNELIISDKPLPQSDEITNNILTFAGTIENKSDIRSHLKNIAKDIVTNKRNLKETENIVENARAEQRERCQENTQNQRFKVVNCYRAGLIIKPSTTTDDNSEHVHNDNNNNDNFKKEQKLNEFTVVDIEKQSITPIDDDENLTIIKSSSSVTVHEPSCATFLYEPINPANDKYVFDIYYISKNQTYDEDRNLIDELLCCEEIQQNMQQQLFAMNDDDDNDDDDNENGNYGNESDDSNDEMNWRNDYPDSDNSNKSYMGDMRRALSDSDFDQYALSDDEDLVFACEEYIDEYVRNYSYDSECSD